MADVYRITQNLFKASEFLRCNFPLTHLFLKALRDLCDPHQVWKYVVHYLLISFIDGFLVSVLDDYLNSGIWYTLIGKYLTLTGI